VQAIISFFRNSPETMNTLLEIQNDYYHLISRIEVLDPDKEEESD
jgi:hypothetical protein